MSKKDIKGLIGLIILVICIWVLQPAPSTTAPVKQKEYFGENDGDYAACPDFPPVDGAGRPAVCDEKH